MLRIISLSALLLTVGAFQSPSIKPQRISTKNYGVIESLSSFSVADLFSGPAATYNGELISKTLKVVERAPKPANYEYGAVSADATPILAVSLLLIISFAAIIPYILAIGETALKQQREREVDSKIGDNLFAKKAREQKSKK